MHVVSSLAVCKKQKMTVINILNIVDAICNKYNRYGIDEQNDLNVSDEDAFTRFHAVVDAAFQKAKVASNKKKRVSAVALNAKTYWTKAQFLEDDPKLQRLVINKAKGL